ncbi:MAG TPA: hypothetical protein VMH30_04065, partial [Verrucomicrobiae bacterium]|nr:hypothetical protein [Verrucomicrobiae bacterium]
MKSQIRNSRGTNMKMTTPKLLATALFAAGFAVTISAQTPYYAATAQDLQSDLTEAAAGSNPSGSIIYLENDPTQAGGYFLGNFNYNSATTYPLQILVNTVNPSGGTFNVTNTIDGGGTGRGLNITSGGSVTVNGITFMRNC